jgi:hypothetical protein
LDAHRTPRPNASGGAVATRPELTGISALVNPCDWDDLLLVDEYRFWVHPIIFGGGKRL